MNKRKIITFLSLLGIMSLLVAGCNAPDSNGLGDSYLNNVYPGITNTYTLGSQSYVWKSGYFRTSYFPALTVAPPSVSGFIGLHAMESHNITALQAVNGGGFMYELSEDTYFAGRNTTGSQINKGQVIYINGATGNVPNVALARADNITTVRASGFLISNLHP